MKPNLISLTIISLLPAAAFATEPPNAEKQVFGVQRSATTTATEDDDAKKTPEAKKSQGILPGLSTSQPKPREEAKKMYDRFNSGDLLFANKLRDAANASNPWASLQYGYLAHKGRLPGQKGPDYVLAQRAYMKAVKNKDGSLTGNYLAAYNLGVLYFHGGGNIKKDPTSALRWFQTANLSYRELRKSKTAVFWPASLYTAQIQGGNFGVKAEPAAARENWKNAIKGNDPVAFYGYAQTIYRENPFAAMNYYKRAADRWHVPSMVALARWNGTGDRLHQADVVQAASWMLRAAHYDSRHNQTSAQVMARLSVEQQKKARESAAQWLRMRGVRPTPFDYKSPLNEDPTTNR